MSFQFKMGGGALVFPSPPGASVTGAVSYGVAGKVTFYSSSLSAPVLGWLLAKG